MTTNFTCNGADPNFLSFLRKIQNLLDTSLKLFTVDLKSFNHYFTHAFEELLLDLPRDFSYKNEKNCFEGEYSRETKEIIDYLFSAWGEVQEQSLPFSYVHQNDEVDIYNQILYAKKQFDLLRSKF